MALSGLLSLSPPWSFARAFSANCTYVSRKPLEVWCHICPGTRDVILTSIQLVWDATFVKAEQANVWSNVAHSSVIQWKIPMKTTKKECSNATAIVQCLNGSCCMECNVSFSCIIIRWCYSHHIKWLSDTLKGFSLLNFCFETRCRD